MTVASNQRLVSACMAVALLALVLLFVHATSITPRDLRLADVGGDDVGLSVRVRGHVHRVDTTDEGNAALVLLDYEDFGTLRVIARPHAISNVTDVAPGAFVAVVGSVFVSGGMLQVFSEEVDGVSVLAPPSGNLLTLEFVARNAARLQGHHVVVRSLVGDIRALVDSRHALLVQGSHNMWAYDPTGWTEGQKTISGRLLIMSRGRCELFVGHEPQASEATVASLASCPDSLVGRPVLVRNVTVKPGELFGTVLTLRDLGDGAEFRMAAFVRGWDWREEARQLAVGQLITVEGTVEYQDTEARWRIESVVPPRR